MAKTMILFLSTLRENAPQMTFSSDFGDIEGIQTNEAPTKYAIKRLAANGGKLDRVIALVTKEARRTALDRYRGSISAYCAEIGADAPAITPVDIADNVSATELLQETLAALLPLAPEDGVIIETTGGSRQSISALTLLSRFLRYGNAKVEFSTFANTMGGVNVVADTRETDDLWRLLDAVNLFAVSGNPKELVNSLKNVRNIPEKTELAVAMRDFYDTILCCKISRLDVSIEKLRAAIDGITNAQIPANDPKLLVFRDLVREIVVTKMAFIRERAYLLPLVAWLLDNDYVQQAVTIIWEKMMISKDYKRRSIDEKHFEKVRTYRNNFNHANGEELNDTVDNVKAFLADHILPKL